MMSGGASWRVFAIGVAAGAYLLVQVSASAAQQSHGAHGVASHPEKRATADTANSATLEDTSTAQPTDAGPPACVISAPSCFTGCASGSVRTSIGGCVPTGIPAHAQSSAGRRLKRSADFSGSEAHEEQVNALGGPRCCMARLRVTATGVQNLGDHVETIEVQADVKVNGQLVGAVPVDVQLPVGDYWVEVLTQDSATLTQAELVKLRSEAKVALQARYAVPLSAEQQEARDAFRKQRAKALQEARRAARIKRQAEKDAAWIEARDRQRAAYQAELKEWEDSTQEDRDARAWRKPVGWIALAAGGALMIAGSAFEFVASDINNQARDLHDDWLSTADPDQQAVLAGRVQSLEKTRNFDHALGLTGLIVGGASVITGSVLLLTLPGIPEEPQKPRGISFTPALGPSLAGGTLHLRF